MVNRALRLGPPAVIAQLNSGQAVDPELIYFRGSPVLEAPDGPHAWVNRHIFVADGECHPLAC